MKITTKSQLVSASAMAALLPQNAVIRIEIPADAIMATTAGRSDPRIPCSRDRFRYFR